MSFKKKDYLNFRASNKNKEEKFEDTKSGIRSRKSEKDRQCNGQKKKYEKTTNDPHFKNTHKSKD
jgi:hypothetical protein